MHRWPSRGIQSFGVIHSIAMISFKIFVVVFASVICWSVLAEAAECGNWGCHPNPKRCPNPPFEIIRNCRRNEKFQCCGACEQLSCNKRYSNVRCIECPSGCYCKDGYIRQNLPNGQLGMCIPIGDCPPITIDPQLPIDLPIAV